MNLKYEINTTHWYTNLLILYEKLPLYIKESIHSLQIVKFNIVKEQFFIFGEYVHKTFYLEHNTKLIDFITNIKNDQTSSCIRTSSNWICCSSIYYGRLFGCEFNLSLNNLEDIG